MKDYNFDKTISKEVLENYLTRSATAANLVNSDTLKDDLRAIKNLGIKFLGRASGVWEPEPDDKLHFEKSKALAKAVHNQDSDIILQSCVFEIVYPVVETFPVPQYVFEHFDLKPEERCFCYSEMIFKENPPKYTGGYSGSIPDITRLETQLWFFYRATKYIDCGYEALHMGQIHLYTANDRGMEQTWKLFNKIRDYAEHNARRHKVLLDAHTHGVSRKGELLFDYHAMPYTRMPLLNQAGEKLVFIQEGFSEGGKNPNGWEAESMPFLMEYDNWGGKVVKDFSQYTDSERAWLDWWGYDQIGWFAYQDEESRNNFLEYTYKWTAINNPNAYFEIPFRRGLENAAKITTRFDNGVNDIQYYYQLNNQSDDCPMGFNQEDTIKRLWDEDNEYKKYSNPAMLLKYGANNEYDSETGLKLPEKVVVYGSFQPYVGAVANDSSNERTRMYYIGDNIYSLSIIMPYPGTYDYAVSTYGTLSATYCYDRFPRSGSSNKGEFTIEKNNTIVRFTYKFIDNIVTVEIL